MKQIAVFILTILISSCSNGQDKKDVIINKLKTIDNWKIEFVKGKTDTVGIKNWLPNTELAIKFQNKKDSNCLQPYFNFYPVVLETYIEKKLLNYLILRATLYPPSPNIYKTDNYMILGWNLIDYDNKKCCECQNLENELTEILDLKIIQKPQDIWKWLSENPIPIKEVKEIIQIAIDLPELQQYFHIETDTTRSPLIIKEFGLITENNMKGIKKFGKELVVLNENEIKNRKVLSYLNIGDWTYSGKSLRLQIDYEIEGIMINYLFKRENGKWEIDNSLIVEN